MKIILLCRTKCKTVLGKKALKGILAVIISIKICEEVVKIQFLFRWDRKNAQSVPDHIQVCQNGGCTFVSIIKKLPFCHITKQFKCPIYSGIFVCNVSKFISAIGCSNHHCQACFKSTTAPISSILCPPTLIPSQIA